MVMRQGLLWLSEQQGIFNFVRRNPLAQKFASRFVAGETVESATTAAVTLQGRGIVTTLDLLGESVRDVRAAAAARDEYLHILELMARKGLQVNASVKLTQMGFDVDEAACADNIERILARARELGGFVRLDMESSAYTQRTLDFYFNRFYDRYREHCGLVIQSALRRSAADVERLIEARVRVRLCKGAYLEPADVAFPDKADVDRSFIQLMERLMEAGTFPGIATHDERIIEHARRFAQERGIGLDRFEFQMLYGVRRDLQERLRAAGYGMRIYVPFGTQWYPYLMRRLAERPANVVFILGNVVKETVGGR